MIDSLGDLKMAIAEHFENHFKSCQEIKLEDWHYNFRFLNESNIRLLE